MLNNKTILITGGTGSFGKKFTERILAEFNPKKIIIYSRDEYKQFVMRQKFAEHDNKIRYFIGDVRDKDRLYRALHGVDIVIHAAALKQVPACEYNPIEAIKTNIDGATNIIESAIDRNVEKVIALSTDKAVNPINLYGATKLVSDKLFVSGNAYSSGTKTKFSVVRYGNVAGSRGSVIPFFKKLLNSGAKELPITDFKMTRFWITLDQGVDLVFKAIKESSGGEIYVSKIPSFTITDLAKAMDVNITLKEVGIREGEKLHEVMVAKEDSFTTYEYENTYIIYPQLNWWSNESHFIAGGKKVNNEFVYSSNGNLEWLKIEDLKNMLKAIDIVY
ncbi:MAG: UDP-N-acetylglucosamine 4,6-dehydratase (inverting) [bacterium]|nr:UDP-N-acetylglucosamine 4,6-dehydratase (inverting) [bacterium]